MTRPTKEMRAEAKARGAGVVHVRIVFPSRAKFEASGIADAAACRFMKWAAAAALCPEFRDRPDVQEFLRSVVDRPLPGIDEANRLANRRLEELLGDPRI